MNKLVLIFIILLCSISLCQAQSSDRFWNDFLRLRESNDYSGMLTLLNLHSKDFLHSDDCGRFAYFFLLSESQSSLQQYDQAQYSFEKCTLLLQKMSSQELEKMKGNDFGRTLLGRYYYTLGTKHLYADQLQNAEEALLICYNLLFAISDHEQLPLFRDLHFQLAQLYLRLNNMPTALRYLKDSKIGSEANLLFDNVYCRGLILSGIIYLSQENYLKAKMYFDEAAYTIENSRVAQTHAVSLVNTMLGACYLKMGYPIDATRILISGIEKCKKLEIKDSRLANLYSSLGCVHLFNNDIVSAKALFKKAYDIVKKDNSKTMHGKLLEASNLAVAQFLTKDGRYKKMVIDLSQNIIDDILAQFIFLSSDERTRYWEGQINYIEKFNAMLYLSGDRTSYDQIYKNVIFSKGLLLRTNNYITKQLLSTDNKNLQQDAQRLMVLQSRLVNDDMNQEYKQVVKDSIRIIEKKLSINLISYQSIDSLKSLYDYQTIHRYLDKNEAAIEFIKLPELTINADSIKEYYAAIIIKHNSGHPQIVRLCADSVLRSIKEMPETIKNSRMMEDAMNELYRQYLYGKGHYVKKRVGKKALKFDCIGDSVFHMIWQPIEQYLNGINKIYYSTAGQLNTLSIGAIPVDSMTLSEKYLMYYVSSTSQIPQIKNQIDTSIANATLYGGINYDTDTAEMITQSRGYDTTHSNNSSETNLGRGGERGLWNFLTGSESEVLDISAQLDSVRIQHKVYSASRANEESFKSVSGNSPDLFHIATHGFFYSNAKDRGIESFLSNIKGLENVNYAQAAMSRSGILFSGANKAWHGEKNNSMEDGILTAEEISHLDLSKTKMVILSACETGLGVDVPAEGVFGLQRAFKLAGVQTLVMSLWKVPDTETSLLMRTFYHNWLRGMDRHEAFRHAQNTVRNLNPNPYFWAGFVMLD